MCRTGNKLNVFQMKKKRNKKVLLRKRKRHTACRVVSTPCVVLTGYPPAGYPPILTWPRGVPCQGGTQVGYSPSWSGWGGPYLGTPSRVPPSWPGWGYPTWVPLQDTPLAGYPQAGYPPGRVPLAGYPSRVPLPQQGTPLAGPGRVPPPPQLDLAGYPPRCLSHGILGNVAKHCGIWVPPQVWTN